MIHDIQLKCGDGGRSENTEWLRESLGNACKRLSKVRSLPRPLPIECYAQGSAMLKAQASPGLTHQVPAFCWCHCGMNLAAVESSSNRSFADEVTSSFVSVMLGPSCAKRYRTSISRRL